MEKRYFPTYGLEELTWSTWPSYSSNIQIQCNPYQSCSDILQEREHTKIQFFTITKILKFRPLRTKAFQQKMSQNGGITHPDVKLHYKNITIKIVWYWSKKRQRTTE